MYQKGDLISVSYGGGRRDATTTKNKEFRSLISIRDFGLLSIKADPIECLLVGLGLKFQFFNSIN